MIITKEMVEKMMKDITKENDCSKMLSSLEIADYLTGMVNPDHTYYQIIDHDQESDILSRQQATYHLRGLDLDKEPSKVEIEIFNEEINYIGSWKGIYDPTSHQLWFLIGVDGSRIDSYYGAGRGLEEILNPLLIGKQS